MAESDSERSQTPLTSNTSADVERFEVWSVGHDGCAELARHRPGMGPTDFEQYVPECDKDVFVRAEEYDRLRERLAVRTYFISDNTRLRKALERWTEHASNCASRIPYSPQRGFNHRPCDCGLSLAREALSEASPAPETSDSLSEARKLANDVGGAFTYFEPAVRAAIGNTNYTVIMDRVRKIVDEGCTCKPVETNIPSMKHFRMTDHSCPVHGFPENGEGDA